MKNTLTRTKNTVSATYLPYAAYKSALALATAHKGKIDKTAEGNFKATFNSVKTAEKFVAEWTAEYNANRKVSVEPTVAPTQKPKASKGKTANNKVVVTVDGKQFLVDASALVPAQTSKKSEPTVAKSKITSSTKKTPRKTKGTKPTLNDFVIANPSCTRDEAKAYGFKGTRAELKALKVSLGVR